MDENMVTNVELFEVDETEHEEASSNNSVLACIGTALITAGSIWLGSKVVKKIKNRKKKKSKNTVEVEDYEEIDEYDEED